MSIWWYIMLACLYYVGKALEKDPMYAKGIVFKEKILADCPYLQSLAIDFCQNWWDKQSIYDGTETAFRLVNGTVLLI